MYGGAAREMAQRSSALTPVIRLSGGRCEGCWSAAVARGGFLSPTFECARRLGPARAALGLAACGRIVQHVFVIVAAFGLWDVGLSFT